MNSFSCTHPNEWGLPSPALQQFILLRSEPQRKTPVAGAICERSRGWCSGSLLVMPLSSGRFPEPDPPHPGTQGRGGVKTWRAFAWSPWACNHLLPAPAQLATFDPTKFELKRGWWQRSSSLRWRSGGGEDGGRAEIHGLEIERNLAVTRLRIRTGENTFSFRL